VEPRLETREKGRDSVYIQAEAWSSFRSRHTSRLQAKRGCVRGWVCTYACLHTQHRPREPVVRVSESSLDSPCAGKHIHYVQFLFHPFRWILAEAGCCGRSFADGFLQSVLEQCSCSASVVASRVSTGCGFSPKGLTTYGAFHRQSRAARPTTLEIHPNAQAHTLK